VTFVDRVESIHRLADACCSTHIATGSKKDAGDLIATKRGEAVIIVNGSTITLRNALYVPRLSTNLISFVQLVKSKAVISVKEDGLKIVLNGNHTLSVNT
jgi:Holliday junction resolvase